MITDPVADYLTRIRNGIMAKHKEVLVPFSKMKKAITDVLVDKGYLKSYEVLEQKIKGTTLKFLRIVIKYTPGLHNNQAAIVKLTRVSKPGLRKYTKASDMPHVINGLGIAIVSTSKGVLSDKEARKQNLGGEILCYVY